MEDAERALASYAEERRAAPPSKNPPWPASRPSRAGNDLYTEGLADFLNVLQAQGSLFATEDQLVQSEQRVSQNLVAIYKAIGGGWPADVGGASRSTDNETAKTSPSAMSGAEPSASDFQKSSPFSRRRPSIHGIHNAPVPAGTGTAIVVLVRIEGHGARCA